MLSCGSIVGQGLKKKIWVASMWIQDSWEPWFSLSIIGKIETEKKVSEILYLAFSFYMRVFLLSYKSICLVKMFWMLQ